MTKNLLKSWFETTRPKTLPLAAASIVMGSALAYWAGSFNPAIASLCLLTTLLLQILSNFANDYGDYQKGSDTAERIGPLRGIQQGQINAKQLKWSLVLMSALSFCCGVWVICLAYQTPMDLWIFLTMGILSIVAAITYTVGAKPYGYLGLGDVSVLLFFGLLGVCGTFYLQTHQLNFMVLLPAFATGFLATAVLNINNLRDIYQDEKSGKHTLVVRIGAHKGRVYHCLLILSAALCYVIFAAMAFHHWVSFAFLLTYPLLFKHMIFVYSHKQPESLRPMLGQMAFLALLVNLLFSFGLIVG